MTESDVPLPSGIVRAKRAASDATNPAPEPSPREKSPRKHSPEPEASDRYPDSDAATPKRTRRVVAPVSEGRITAIEEQVRHKDRVNVYVDGTFALGLFADVAVTLGLKIGQEMTAERLTELADAELRRKAKEDAYRLLSFRARTEKEIVDRLKRREYDEAIIADTVAYLHEQSLLDDADFAARFAATRSRTHGDRAITMELRQKGVDAATIKQTLADSADVAGEDAEYDTVRALAERRVGENPSDKSPGAKQKLWAFLARRGFGSDVIKRVVARLYSGSDDD
ncbi:MAG: RecX family transcriptional regulator [Fibrella sp.]|nr:RecX family transcriptional regulator [Armatimonadota bacterium]